MASKRALIRTDSSVAIGGGHMVRCLALAEELRRCDVKVTFLCQNLAGNISRLALAAGHEVKFFPDVEDIRVGMERQDADASSCIALADPSIDDWLVVDHYGLDLRWELAMRERVGRIFVIDDLANRAHDCDVLLDQNRMRERAKDYSGLVSPECRMFFGPNHAILSAQFKAARRGVALRHGQLRRIMVFFGSSDAENYTQIALQGIALWGRPVDVAVVVGAANPNRQAVQAQCLSMGSAKLHVQTSEMARLIGDADCAIGAAGSSTWERCCLGLPSLVTVCAANQEIVAETAIGQGVAHNMGSAQELTPESIAEQLESLTVVSLTGMETRARDLVDGGGAMRLVKELLL